ncbi:MAG TPA: family 78 glycoside hydrolase catalytic domain [Sedimentisphaerales bacterium]|nr:family 78 glycoside hydrolase catalytic domain [Sedimentisphaerales bacterium]
MKKSLSALILLALLSSCFAKSPQSDVLITDLRCEYLTNPLGIDTTQPRFSFKLQSDTAGQKQTAYQILVASSQQLLDSNKADLFDTSKVKSDNTVNIQYEGKKLSSGQKCFWKVRSWDKDNKPTQFSETACWSMGLLNENDWKGQWISYTPIGADFTDEQWKPYKNVDLPWIRKEFTLEDTPEQAFIYVASFGYHELYINGEKVTIDPLAPAFTQYDKRVLYNTYDVTSYLKKGDNCVGLWLSHGWFRKDVMGVFHKTPVVKLQLNAVLKNNKNFSLATDETWKWHKSSTTLAEIYFTAKGYSSSESQDGRLINNDWSKPVTTLTDWQNVDIITVPSNIKVSAQMCDNNKILWSIKPISIENKEPGKYFVDMGKSFTGFVEIKLHGKVGDKIKIRYLEQELGSEDKHFNDYGCFDQYIIGSDNVETFINRFDFRACRYVEITGLDYQPSIDDITGLFVRTNYKSVSEFQCSNQLLNDIFNTTKYTYQCLTMGGVIVDCPHRERLGYGGDGQSSMVTGLTNFDVSAFYTKWLTNWRDSQHEDTGDVPHTSPSTFDGGGPCWSGICLTLPWEMYLRYGDKQLLEKSYPTFTKWLAYVDTKRKNNILEFYPGLAQSEEWGFLGDWVAPDQIWDLDNPVQQQRNRLFNNCYMLYCVKRAAQIAEILGKTKDAEKYANQVEILKQAIHKEFYDDQIQSYMFDEQVYLTMPLYSGIVPGDMQERIFKRLENAIVVKHNGHLNSGMLGTFFMLRLLDEQGRNDLAYEMINKDTYPSYGYMLKNGSTTITENWGMGASQIHNCYLAVGSWFIEGLGGIKPDENYPGYKHFIINTPIINDLKSAKTSFDSIQGRITTDWKIEQSKWQLKLTVPTNTTATVYVPGNNITVEPKTQILKKQNERTLFLAQPGQYLFTADIAQ